MEPKNKYKVAQRGYTFKEVLRLKPWFLSRRVASEYGRQPVSYL